MAGSPLPLIAIGAAALLLSKGGGEKTGSSPAVEKLPIKIYDLWAPGCEPCKDYAPIFGAVGAANPDIHFERINIAQHPEWLERAETQDIPTTLIELQGEVVHVEEGLLTVPQLQSLVDAAREDYEG